LVFLSRIRESFEENPELENLYDLGWIDAGAGTLVER
jgi:hypothetical protein